MPRALTDAAIDEILHTYEQAYELAPIEGTARQVYVDVLRALGDVAAEVAGSCIGLSPDSLPSALKLWETAAAMFPEREFPRPSSTAAAPPPPPVTHVLPPDQREAMVREACALIHLVLADPKAPLRLTPLELADAMAAMDDRYPGIGWAAQAHALRVSLQARADRREAADGLSARMGGIPGDG